MNTALRNVAWFLVCAAMITLIVLGVVMLIEIVTFGIVVLA